MFSDSIYRVFSKGGSEPMLLKLNGAEGDRLVAAFAAHVQMPADAPAEQRAAAALHTGYGKMWFTFGGLHEWKHCDFSLDLTDVRAIVKE